MNYTKKYWSIGEYTLMDGSTPYEGYVGIYDGRAFIYDNEEPLIPGDAYITNINLSENFIDRTLAHKLKLPYGKTDIQFGANDFLYTSTVKDIINKLQINNDYIFRNNIISNTLLPAADKCLFFASEDKNEYFYQYDDGNTLKPFDKGAKPTNGAINGVKVKMRENTEYLGTVENRYNINNKTAQTAYQECYLTNSDRYSHIPHILIKTTLADSSGGVLKRYDFADKGFGALTKNDPYFYDKLVSVEKYQIRKKDGSYTPECNGDNSFEFDSNVADKDFYYYKENPSFNKQKFPITSQSTIKDLYNYINPEFILDGSENPMVSDKDDVKAELAKYYFIPTIKLNNKAKYKFKIWDGGNANTIKEVEGQYDDKFIDIKNYVEAEYNTQTKKTTYYRFKELIYKADNPEAVGSYKFIPFDSMTAYDCYSFEERNMQAYRSFPDVNYNLNNQFTIYVTNSDGVVSKKNVSGSDKTSLSDNVVYGNNPYYKASYFPINGRTAEAIWKEMYCNGEEKCGELQPLENYEFIPVIKKYNKIERSGEAATFRLEDATNAEIVISDIKIENDEKYAIIYLFLMLKDKVGILKFKQFIDNYDLNLNESAIDFKSSDNFIVFDKVIPHKNNSLSFKELCSIKIHKNDLYLVDKSLNMIMHYDIEYLIDAEENNENQGFDVRSIKLVNSLQGDGKKIDKVYFSRPSYIDADDENVYVVDRGNKCVKVFSHDLNYVKTLQNGYFAQHDIQAVGINPYTYTLHDGTVLDKKSVWIFSVQGSRFYVSILIDDKVVYYGAIESIKVLDDMYSWDEEIKSIKFSRNNSNYLYLSTTKRVYKFHASKPLYPFASLSYFKQRSITSNLIWSNLRYKWNKVPSLYMTVNNETTYNTLTWGYRPPTSSAEILQNKCFTLTGYDYYDKIDGKDKQFKGDIIFHFGNLYDNTKIVDYIKANNKQYKDGISFDNIPTEAKNTMINSTGLFFYIEPDSTISAISDEYFDSFSEYAVTSDFSDEYINPLTFNKLLYQVVHNLISIKELMMGRFRSATNIDGIIVYDSLVLDDYFDLLKMDRSSNYFVHENETISIVVNRIFENILTLQEAIIDNMQTIFMSTQTYVNGNTRII